MNRRWYLFVLVAVGLACCGGCSDDDRIDIPDLPAGPFGTLLAAGTAYVNGIDCPGLVTAETVNAEGYATYTIFDLRTESEFLADRIPGAHRTTLPTLLDDVDAVVDKSAKILVVCKSGQTAGHAKIALELMGYDDVHSLAFGMCDWDVSLSAAWDSHRRDLLATPELQDNNGQLVENDWPSQVDWDSLTEENVVETRVRAMLTAGFKKISYAELGSLVTPFVLNYVAPEDHDGSSGEAPGHIPGAYQFTPRASLGADQMLDNLPGDGTPIVVVSWTGQTSSQIAAYLNILGYDAYSLTYGANDLFHSSLTAVHRWDGTTNALDLAHGQEPADPSPAFAAMVAAGAAYVNGPDIPGVVSAQTVDAEGYATYTIFDMRSDGDYNAGHIPGAIKTTVETLLADIDVAGTSLSDKILLVCKTGQTVGHPKIALELLGYTDVLCLEFGMCDWHTSLAGPWNGNSRNLLPSPEQQSNNALLTVQPWPTELDGIAPETVVAERAAAMLAGGFKRIAYYEFGLLDDPFVISYCTPDEYDGTGEMPGHIPGSYQFTPGKSLDIWQMLKYLPSDGTPIVVYGRTGQVTSQVAAYLNMLGYDAYTMLFGAHILFYDSLSGYKWTGTTNVFDLEP